MADTNPDEERKRLEAIAAKLPGELVSREAAFPVKRQRPKARLPEQEEKKLEEKAREEAAKDKEADTNEPSKNTPGEKPKFKVTRSPFAPRIDQQAREKSAEVEPLSWGDEDEIDTESLPAAKTRATPEKLRPTSGQPANTPLPRGKEPIAEPRKEAEPRTKAPLEAKQAKQTGPQSPMKPVDDKSETTPVLKPTAPKETPYSKPIPTPAAKKAPSKPSAPPKSKPASALASPAPKSGDGPTRLPKPAASAPAPRPKAAPRGPARHEVTEAENENVSVLWVAVDGIAAIVSLVFAVLVFLNMGA